MTDTAYPVTAITGHEYLPVAFAQSHAVDSHPRYSVPAADGNQEDDGQISCICGYIDDDGWTVACDSCNRWQHQMCYYPQYEDRSLPEDLQHYCVECNPRPFDVDGARIRQQIKREEQAGLTNGAKRPTAKSHKKKVKEPVFANGWPLDKARHDRNSASPRDQPPPPKRPKTSHRASDSTTSLKGHSRKRNVSSVNHRRSLSRSPETPVPLYSPEFLQAQRNENWAVAHTNLHNSIRVTNELSEWLTLPDDEFHQRHGQFKAEVLMRWDGELEDIPGKAELQVREVQDRRIKDGPDSYPVWKTVTVAEAVAVGAYIGELKGHVGFKKDYLQDPTNRWSLLRHPEPFVFFHPRLPIYIDSRHEGTDLRFVRRSCSPNAKLQILVTDQTDYRFCFMAVEQIEPGMEIAVGWDTADSLPDLVSRGQVNVSERDLDQLSIWVSTVLSNCGPCACQSDDCYMSRFDKRIDPCDGDALLMKTSKQKRRKAGQNLSPLNTHTNSRSGSEARKADPDDERTDSRSTSGSAGRGSASRDITPNTHYSHNGSLSTMPELSERERRKLLKEEEMFRRQEEEQSGRQGKKKRPSGGSTLSTPGATTAKQSGLGIPLRYIDAGVSRQSGLPSAKSVGSKRGKNSATPKIPRTITRVVKRPKPDYVDAEIQCDLEQEQAEKHTPLPERRRPFISITDRLLRRCAVHNTKRKVVASPGPETPEPGDAMVVDQPITAAPNVPDDTQPTKTDFETQSQQHLNDRSMPDSEMKDAPAGEDVAPDVKVESTDKSEGTVSHPPDTSSAPLFSSQPSNHMSAPPWPSQASHFHLNLHPLATHPQKPSDMHLHMPPPVTNPFATGATGTPTSATGSISQSPLSTTGPASGNPIFSPSVNAAVQPSPARKKLSLSDYTKRSKAKDKDSSNDSKPFEREISPASTASGPIVPPLQPSSAELAKAGDSSSAIEEDTKMEDAEAGGVAAAAAADERMVSARV